MLVVMLILMVATAAAAMSVQATQYELQAAGHERQALQTRYVSEAVMLTTVSWFDKVFDPVTGGGFTRFYDNCSRTDDPDDPDDDPTPPLEMWRYGQPEVDVATHTACRMTWLGMRQIDPQSAGQGEVSPVTLPVSPSQTVSPGEATPDYLGSLGPRQAYHPQLAFDPDDGPDFVADFVCRPEIVEAGTVVAGSTTTTRTRRYYCVVTARASIELQGSAASRSWEFGAETFQQKMFSTYHETRMTLLTPEEVF
jgi:hypothetical protein